MGTVNLGRVRGNMWYTGDAMTGTSAEGVSFPESGISKAYANDLYLASGTGNVYQCITPGDANTAKWIYVGNLKGPMPETVDDFSSYSTKKALSANAGRILKKTIDEAGLYTKKVIPDCSEGAYVIKLHMENVSSVISIKDINGNTGSYTYTQNGEGSEADCTISVGSAIGLPEGAVVQSIESSEAHIFSYILYGDGNVKIHEETPSIWKNLVDLQEDNQESMQITETSEESSEQTATYRTSAFSRLVDGVRTAMFQITHAKAVWWNKLDNKTVYDKISEECVKDVDEATEADIDEIVGSSQGGGSESEVTPPGDEVTTQEIDEIIDELFE